MLMRWRYVALCVRVCACVWNKQKYSHISSTHTHTRTMRRKSNTKTLAHSYSLHAQLAEYLLLLNTGWLLLCLSTCCRITISLRSGPGEQACSRRKMRMKDDPATICAVGNYHAGGVRTHRILLRFQWTRSRPWNTYYLICMCSPALSTYGKLRQTT